MMGTTIKKLDVKITADNSKLKAGLKQSNQQVNKFSSSLKKMGAALGGAFAITKVASFFKESVRLYGIQEKAEKKLADSINATGGSINELLPRYKALASSIQEVTTVGDEVTLGLIALGKQMSINDADMEKATKGAIGLSKAFGIDLNTSMKMIAAAIQGDTTLLNRYIPALRFAKTEAEKMTIVNEAMANGWAVATGEVETFAGKMEQLGNKIGDFKEKIGGLIADIVLYSDTQKRLGKQMSDNFAMQDAAYVKLRKQYTAGGADQDELTRAMREMAKTVGEGTENYNAQLIAVRKNIAQFPKLAKANDFVTAARNKEKGVIDEVNKAKKEAEELAEKEAKALKEKEEALKKAKEASEKLAKATRDLNRDTTAYVRTLEAEAKMFKLMEGGIEDTEEGQEDLNDEIENGVDLGNDFAKTTLKMAKGLEKVKGKTIPTTAELRKMADQIFNTGNVISDLVGLLDEDLGSALEQTTSLFANFAAGNWVAVISDAIPTLESLGNALFNLTLNDNPPWTEEQIAEWLSQMEEFADSVGMTLEELVQDGFEDFNLLGINYEQMLKGMEINTKESMGIISDIISGAINMMGALSDVVAPTPDGGTPLPTPGVKPGKGFASGANFVVPEGFNNDSFPMRVSSGEHVKVTPAGQGGGDEYNLNISMSGASADPQALVDSLIVGLRMNKSNVNKEIKIAAGTA